MILKLDTVKMDIFDEHHKTLVDLLNLLHNVCNDCDNKSIIFFVVESLKDCNCSAE
jgi:hemerythrin